MLEDRDDEERPCALAAVKGFRTIDFWQAEIMGLEDPLRPCADCGCPIAYDGIADVWRHVWPAPPTCFMVECGAAENAERTPGYVETVLAYTVYAAWKHAGAPVTGLIADSVKSAVTKVPWLSNIYRELEDLL